MIDLDKVKPGDIVSWKGMKSKVRHVGLQRLEDMTTEVSAISIKVLEGEDKYDEPTICPGGFKSLSPWVESVRVGDVFERNHGTRDWVKAEVVFVDGGQAVVRIIKSPFEKQVGLLFVHMTLELNSDKFMKVSK